MLAAWSLADGRLTRIAGALGETATPIKRSALAIVDTNAFAMERSIGRVYANVWTIDLRSGKRVEVARRIEDRYLQASPGGRYVLYVKDGHYLDDGDRDWPDKQHHGQCRNVFRRQGVQ